MSFKIYQHAATAVKADCGSVKICLSFAPSHIPFPLWSLRRPAGKAALFLLSPWHVEARAPPAVKASWDSMLCEVPASHQETGSLAPEPQPTWCLRLQRPHPGPCSLGLHPFLARGAELPAEREADLGPRVSDRDKHHFSTSGLLIDKYRRKDDILDSLLLF